MAGFGGGGGDDDVHHRKTVDCRRGPAGPCARINAVMLESKFEQDASLNRNAVGEPVGH